MPPAKMRRRWCRTRHGTSRAGRATAGASAPDPCGAFQGRGAPRSTRSMDRPARSCGRAAPRSNHGITSAGSPSRTAAPTSRLLMAPSTASVSRPPRRATRRPSHGKDMLTINRTITGALAFAGAIAVATVHAQVGRGGSEWLTARADAQRTSWIRTDPKISVESMSKPGFELQWTTKLENKTTQANALMQGVTANGVTLFVPMSIVAGSANTIYAIDNDTGYLVWQRTFDVAAPATPSAAGCPGGITAAATRIVPLMPPPIAAPGTPGGGRAAQSYRTVVGQPGMGVPLEARGRPATPVPPAAGAAPPPSAAAPNAVPPAARAAAGSPGAAGAGGQPQRQGPETPARGAAPPQGGGGGRGNAGPSIPGAPPLTASGFGRPSGVVYTIASDGMLHVLGLRSGKDLQRPATFLPANAKWSDAIAVNTTLYATTSGTCAGAANGLWAIDLESEQKPVVSWKSGDDEIVGAVAFTTDGTAIVAKHNAIVALDAKSLQEKDFFTAAGTEFVSGPTVFRHHDKEIVAAATKDGRILLLDAASLGGANHATPLFASKPIVATGSIAGDALATWQEFTIAPAPAPAPSPAGAAPAFGAAAAAPANVTWGTRWIVAPVTGGVVALKLTDSAGALSLDHGWTARNLTAPTTPIVVNGVVFALSTGRSTGTASAGTPAVLRAYQGSSGKLLWDSKTAIKSSASAASFWSAFGQLYVGTTDGTVYAFGFLDERR